METQPIRRSTATQWLRRGELVDRTRRLFVLFPVGALLLSLPALLSGVPATVGLTGGAVALLLLTWVHGYRTRYVARWLDVVEVVALIAFVAAVAEPVRVLGFLFWAVWFRSLYGSTRAAVIRSAAQLVGVGLGLALWPHLPGHTGDSQAAGLLGALPLAPLSLVVVRRLYSGITQVSRVMHREAALKALGADLVGEVELPAVRSAGWKALEALCIATPGLRVALLREEGGSASLVGGAGPWEHPLQGGHLRGRPIDALVTGAALDTAAGTTGAWTWLESPVPGDVCWLVAGGDRFAAEALDAVKLVTDQVALAISRCAAHATLVERASIDTLTGLPNRTTFRDAVDLLLLENQTHGCAVLFVDLDDFKYVNDGFGHGAGDDVLRVTAQRLRECVREGDLCARLGGDEFAILLRHITVEGAEAIAHRISDALAEPVHVVTGMAAGQVQVGSSVGVAHSAGVVAGVDEMVQRADVAMYSAKTAGGGVSVFGRRSAAAEAEAVLLRELAAATGRGQMEVHYQPVVDLTEDAANSSCSGMEALVRWNHPDKGLLGPQDFISRAERTGAIHEIGAHVLAQACKDAAAWTVAGRPLTVHVNVSVAQLSDDRLLTTVRQCLRRSALPPEQLVLEITESMVLEAPDAVRRVHELAAYGVRIAVDDFGTGYASLTALRHLPVSIVKVDRSFVAGAMDNPADLAIIEAVVQMAERLGIEIVAEGVEEVEQAHLLAAAGAHHAQGFLYAMPLPRPLFDEWLATRTPLVARPARRPAPKTVGE